MSATRPRPAITNPNTPGGGKGAAPLPRTGHVSPEGRQRLSEIAKQRHQESGGRGFSRGLTKPGTRRKKPSRARVAKMVAEAALEKANAEAIIDVFKDGIHPSKPMHIRLKAAEAWLRIENEEGRLALQEEVIDDQQRDRSELLSILSEKLTSGYGALLLRNQIEQENTDDDVIEGSVVDDDDDQPVH